MAQKTEGVPQIAQELKDLVIGYAKQETVEPIKGLGRYLAFGIGGSVAMGMAAVLLLLALLRALQTETGSAFDGNWSFAPYLLVLAVVAVLLAVIGLVIKRVKTNQMGRSS